MKRLIYVCMILSLVMGLSGCRMFGGSKQTTAAPGTTQAPGSGTSQTPGGSGVGGTGNSVGDAIGGVIDDALDMTDLPFDKNASVMVSGKRYRLTEEVLRTDELGPQIVTVSNVVLGDPTADGDGFGVKEGTKIYSIKNNTAMDAVAVEVEGTLYRAILHEEDTATTKAPASTTKASASSAGANARGKVTGTSSGVGR